MFERLGRAMYRYRIQVIAIWVVVLLLSAPFAPRVTSVLRGGGFANGVSQADEATARLVSDLHFFPSNVTVIFTSKTLTTADPRFQTAMEAALAPVRKFAHVVRIDTYYFNPASLQDLRMISDDGHSALAIMQYDVSFDLVQGLVPGVRAAIHSTTLQTLVAGDGAVFSDIQQVSGQDLQKVETYSFPIALLLLITIFGTLVASGVPLVTGVFSVVPTLAILYAVGHVMDLSIFCLNVTSMIGLGVGIDYALFVVSRFREEVHHRSVEDAVAIAIDGAGRAVMFSGVTVMIGLCGLLIFRSSALRSIGLGGSLVVLMSVLTALTLLPAILSVLGPRIDALPLIRGQRGGRSRFWHGLAQWVMRYPWPVIAAVLATVTIIALPFRALHLNVPDATILPKTVPSRIGFDILNTQFHQQQDNPVVIIVHAAHDLLSPSSMGALYDYVNNLQQDPGVIAIRTRSLVKVVPFASRAQYQRIRTYLKVPLVAAALQVWVGNNSTVVSLQPKHGQSSAQLEALVKRIRANSIGAGLQRFVGGYDAGVMDYLTNLYDQFPICILFVVVTTYLVLMVLLRSVILPLKAVLMNALSLLGAYGAVVWVFQQGHLSGLFNFSPTGYVDEITPIIMFCTLFGLSMDYEVFLLSRIREQYLLTGDNTASVARGLERTGRIITSAALILVVVAGSFAFTDIVLIKAVGLGLSFAILLDATLIRCLLVPATMRVLGNWNWWMPRFLLRLFGANVPTAPLPTNRRHVA